MDSPRTEVDGRVGATRTDPNDRTGDQPADATGAPLFDLGEALGGRRGILDASLPGTVLVIVAVFAPLWWAIAASILTAAGIGGLRIARHETLRQAASGVLGLVLAACLAAFTGSAKTFFLPGIAINGAYAVGVAASIVARRPVLGYIAQALDKRFVGWRGNRPLRRAATAATAVWAVVFLSRFLLMGWLYLHDHTTWLATAKLAMGWPLWGVAVMVSLLLLQPPADTPAPEAASEPVTQGS